MLIQWCLFTAPLWRLRSSSCNLKKGGNLVREFVNSKKDFTHRVEMLRSHESYLTWSFLAVLETERLTNATTKPHTVHHSCVYFKEQSHNFFVMLVTNFIAHLTIYGTLPGGQPDYKSPGEIMALTFVGVMAGSTLSYSLCQLGQQRIIAQNPGLCVRVAMETGAVSILAIPYHLWKDEDWEYVTRLFQKTKEGTSVGFC